MNLDTIVQGDALAYLKMLPDNCVNTIVTSPPYYALRDYGVDGQLGLESTPQEYLARMTAVFSEARRVLRDDGVCWVNMGDSYNNSGVSDPSSVGGFTGERIRNGHRLGLICSNRLPIIR